MTKLLSKKGKSLEVIADEVEETPDAIRELYERLVNEVKNEHH